MNSKFFGLLVAIVCFQLSPAAFAEENQQLSVNVEIKHPNEPAIAACRNGISAEAEIAAKEALAKLPKCADGLIGHVSVGFMEIDTEGASSLCIATANRDCQP